MNYYIIHKTITVIIEEMNFCTVCMQLLHAEIFYVAPTITFGKILLDMLQINRVDDYGIITITYTKGRVKVHPLSDAALGIFLVFAVLKNL